MITIGIDVAKETLVGVILSKSSGVLDSFTLENSPLEINNWLQSIKGKYTHITVASEATAEFHRTLALLCLEYKIPFRLLNPIVTKQFTKATIRKRKTDVSDALTIAKLAQTGEGRMVSEKSFDIAKSYSRTAAKLVQVAGKLHLMQMRLSTISPDDKVSFASLENCIKELKESTLVFRQQASDKIDGQKVKLLESIPGVGQTIACVLIAEIGDISQFRSAKALVAYAGIDPKVKQSGRGLKHNTRLTKRGSPYLRQALFQAAAVARQHDPELKTYYEKKRAEGKRYKEATVATSRKLLYRVYAVLKRQTPYTK
ncbi:transposase [Candidatus Curtissbacteria bacterium]|nr:transposase [Candidatus Curtissbacteria bacterium]